MFNSSKQDRSEDFSEKAGEFCGPCSWQVVIFASQRVVAGNEKTTDFSVSFEFSEISG